MEGHLFERRFEQEELPALATELLPLLQPAPIVLLQGEMGAGKTSLVQALVHALGSPAPVTSPTFTLVQQYPTPAGTVFHLDLHRIGHPDALAAIGFQEILETATWCFIEWPAVATPWLPASGVTHLEISQTDAPTHRLVRLFRYF